MIDDDGPGSEAAHELERQLFKDQQNRLREAGYVVEPDPNKPNQWIVSVRSDRQPQRSIHDILREGYRPMYGGFTLSELLGLQPDE